MKIYIYKLSELEKIIEFFESPPPEMNLYDFFYEKLKSKHKIVNNLFDSDLAFIPIDFTKLIFGGIKNNQWHNVYTMMHNAPIQSNFVPKSQPPTFGIGQKENFIKFFWDGYVKNNINLNSNVPHFILFSYVLFEVSFEPIDKSVFILSYEDKVSIFNSENTFEIGTKNRMVPIPYIQNDLPNYKLKKIKKYLKCDKKNDLSFIGTLSDENRPVLTSSRAFLKILNSKVLFGLFDDINEVLSKTKYLFVLRGDTPSRLSFYQCFAYDVVPIIFESEVDLYSKILCGDFSIMDSCLIIPNKNSMDDKQYSILIDAILSDELSDNKNYLNKIKNHKNIFNQINYFSRECFPIENVLKIIKNGTKNK
jgi:hypothetical protein